MPVDGGAPATTRLLALPPLVLPPKLNGTGGAPGAPSPEGGKAEAAGRKGERGVVDVAVTGGEACELPLPPKLTVDGAPNTPLVAYDGR
jgi:hypothetical protein